MGVVSFGDRPALSSVHNLHEAGGPPQSVHTLLIGEKPLAHDGNRTQIPWSSRPWPKHYTD